MGLHKARSMENECMEISENHCLNLLCTDACMVVNQQFENSSLYGANFFIYQPLIENE